MKTDFAPSRRQVICIGHNSTSVITSSSSLVTSLFFLLLAAPFPLHVPHYPFIFPLSSTLMACQCRFLPDKEPCLLGSFSRFHVILLCHCDLNILLQRNVVGVQLYAQFRSTSNPRLYMKQPFSVTFAFPTAPPPSPPLFYPCHFAAPSVTPNFRAMSAKLWGTPTIACLATTSTPWLLLAGACDASSPSTMPRYGKRGTYSLFCQYIQTFVIPLRDTLISAPFTPSYRTFGICIS